MELHLKYRPTKISQLIGQPEAAKILSQMVKSKRVPQAILISGPSGCGKTTIARMLKKYLNCPENEYHEWDCGLEGGKHTIASIRERLDYHIIGGDARIFNIDEAHGLTRLAQEAFLKTLEEPPSQTYFVLCTTDPPKLLPTIRTRCVEIKVTALRPPDLERLVRFVAQSEDVRPKLSDDLVDEIVKTSRGSARKALRILESVIPQPDDASRLACIVPADEEAQAHDLARLLIDPRTKWAEVAALLKKIKGDHEGIRRIVLGYCANVLLGGKINPRAAEVIESFRDAWDNWYDTGRTMLVICCYEIISRRESAKRR